MTSPKTLRFSILSLALLAALITSRIVAEDAAPQPEDQRVKSVLEQSLKTDPNNSALWAHLGFADNKLNDVDGAQTAFEKAAALNPQNVDALYMLGLIYEKKKMTNEALKAWNSVLAISEEKWRRDVAGKHIHHLKSNE